MSKIYLISPPKIEENSFLYNLEVALKTKKIDIFQLRLKGYDDEDIINIGKKILPICLKNNVSFIINDYLDLAIKIGAQGVHLGGEDTKILTAKKNSPQNFIIGASCYDSKKLAISAVDSGANYVSFGTFFPSSTKNSQGKPNVEILDWCQKVLRVDSVAIGGINPNNCLDIVRSKATFIAVISWVWNNKNGIKWAIEELFANCTN